MPAQSSPPLDDTQNVESVSGNVENGWTTITFSRALDTGDSDDFKFDDESCAYFLYAWGGNFDANNAPTYHGNREVSTSKICLTSCSGVNPGAGGVIITRSIDFQFRLNETWNADYGNVNSPAYVQLKYDILQMVSMIF